MKADYIKIDVLDNLFEAQLLESLLQEQQIPYRIRSFHDTAYDGLFQAQRGWGEIYAPAAHQAEVLSLLKALRAQNGGDAADQPPA